MFEPLTMPSQDHSTSVCTTERENLLFPPRLYSRKKGIACATISQRGVPKYITNIKCKKWTNETELAQKCG